MACFRLLTVTLSYLTASVLAGTEIFSHLSTTLQIGSVFPQTNLQEYIEPAPSGGLTISTPYYKSIETQAFLHYSFLDATKKSSTPRKINTFVMGMSLVHRPGRNYLPFAGLGLANILIQTRGSRSPQLLMDDKESEFGIIPMLFYRIKLKSHYQIEAGGEWITILSDPKLSHFLRIYFGITRIWW